ncbi:MAG: L-lactate dehydrogenase [Clostridia bacterium]|nr:L-lactate dehydrogenase [Clostridia bacterium]
MVDKRKVVLVGTGFVGMSMAYALENQGGVNELVLIDVLKEKAEGEAMDLAHGLAYAPNRMDIRSGDYEECKDADIVVISAGFNQKPGQTRLDLLKINAEIMKEITEKVVKSGFKGIFVIASNPVDLMTYTVQKVSNFPTERVIGSGTILDTSRLRYLIGVELEISPKNIHTYIMGEHGDSSFAVWSHSYVGCKPLTSIVRDRGKGQDFLDNLCKKVQNSAYEIIEKKRATYYGIGLGLAKLVKSIINNENSITTVSTYINGHYNHSGLYIGVPAVISNQGIKDILNLRLTPEEQEKFDYSFSILDEMKNEIDKKI